MFLVLRAAACRLEANTVHPPFTVADWFSCRWQDVVRPLGIDERTAVLAAAVSIDFDYFSQHSHSGGGMFPFLMPMPTPGYPPPEASPDAAGARPNAACIASARRYNP